VAEFKYLGTTPKKWHFTVYGTAHRDTKRHDMTKYRVWLPVTTCHCMIVWTTAHYTTR